MCITPHLDIQNLISEDGVKDICKYVYGNSVVLTIIELLE